MHKRGKT